MVETMTDMNTVIVMTVAMITVMIIGLQVGQMLIVVNTMVDM
jgi:hypothetical protein